ncbi:TonB-linked outer membrane protein, SusC/RagA family [Parapedobacter composti]|uniref:TonB-linked outer membrane protein, SusC/RagA family n=2 Tax=Parapedobacter composti TaxID=623281 RepID=A0A1I1J9V7_9SPHI|nr:TonB-linked outer membrane protein, SusC/RagA family [Parapedobacter composti]
MELWFSGNRWRPFNKKLRYNPSLLRMKCTVLAIVFCMQTSMAAFSQKISLRVTDTPLETVLNMVKQQSGYHVLYNTELIKQAGNVHVTLKNTDLETAMRAILRTVPFIHEIQEGTIVIKPRSTNNQRPVANQPPKVSPLAAKQQELRGRVVDEQGEALPGVSVTVVGGTTAVQTNLSGVFSLPGVSPDATLQFSAVGYKQQEIRADRLPNPVIMQEDMTMLDDVVVMGYNTQSRRSITGSVASVKGEQIENMPVQSFDRAIQGRAAGVLVQNATGVPGGAVRINIRGIGSITAGTEPMYIVDGVQLNSDEPSGRTSTNAMAYINPNDIESIEILKDAAAAAIYGAQAANGVVLITTKKGQAGRTNFSVNYYEGVSRQTRNMDVLNSQEAITLRIEALMNNDPLMSRDVARAQALTDLGVRPDLTDEELAALPTYDWQGEAFKPGAVRNIEFSASGGSDRSTYYLSGAYNKHDGNVTNIDFERGTFRMRLNQEVTPRLSMEGGVNLSFITQNGNTGSQGNTTGSASPQYTASYMPPTVPIYNPDGSFNAYDGMPGTGFNPIQAATVDDNIVRQRALIGNFSASYKLLENLTFKSFYGIDYRFIRADYYRDPRTPNGAPWNGYLIDDNTENVNFSTNQTLNYRETFASNHTISALLGAEYRSDVREYESARANNFPTYQFRTNQSAAEPYAVTGSWSGNRRMGFFGQVNYDYKNKLFVSAVARYDGSSRFGVNNRFGFFPGISAGWDIAQEDFLKRTAWVDQIKLRAGYGVVGNDQINNVSSRGFYQGGTRYNEAAALRLQTLANPYLGWERNASANVGVDFGFIDNRLFGTVEVFHRTSQHLLLNRPLPQTSGFSNVDDNLGRVVNKGLELELNSVNVLAGDFTWRSNFNISFLHNEVKELYDGLSAIGNTIRVGHPLKIWYRPQFAGVNSANGRSMWYDKDGNITYLPTAEDNVPTKEGWQSDYFGGFSNTFSYKGFEFSALFHFDMGRYMANTMYQVWYNVMSNPGRNTLRELFEDRWTAPGQVTYVARPVAGGAERNSATRSYASSLFLQDASFIRLRDVTLAYRFQPALLQKINVSNARIYLTAVNLHTWTKWVGYDPEFAVDGRVENNQGIVPQTMSLTAGIQIGF